MENLTEAEKILQEHPDLTGDDLEHIEKKGTDVSLFWFREHQCLKAGQLNHNFAQLLSYSVEIADKTNTLGLIVSGMFFGQAILNIAVLIYILTR